MSLFSSYHTLFALVVMPVSSLGQFTMSDWPLNTPIAHINQVLGNPPESELEDAYPARFSTERLRSRCAVNILSPSSLTSYSWKASGTVLLLRLFVWLRPMAIVIPRKQIEDEVRYI